MIVRSPGGSISRFGFRGVALVAVLAMALGCSGEAAEDDESEREAPLEVPEALRITVRNSTDQVQYLDHVDTWMRSASDQVKNAILGSGEAVGSLALRTNQPTCQEIASGEWECGQHGDTQASALVLAPGAEYTYEWNAEVWRRSSPEGTPDCACVEPVPSPAADYLVRIGAGPELACDDAACVCAPGESSCVVLGRVSEPEQLERAVTWPDDAEVLIVLE